MHRLGGSWRRGWLFGVVVLVGLVLVSGVAAGSPAPALPQSAAGTYAAPPARIGHEAGIVPSRTPRVFSHAASHSSGRAPVRADEPGLGSGNLVYNGGPVLHKNTVHAIFWVPSGYSVGANYESGIAGFFQNVAKASGGSSNVYSVGAQYGDTTGPGAYNLTFGGSVVDSDPFPASGCTDGPLAVCLTDGQLQAEIDKVIAAHGWQAGMGNEFFIFTPSPAGSCFDGTSSFCAYSNYCAYHGSFTSSLGKGTVLYANVQYPVQPAAPGACDIGERPNGDDADPAVNLISHEQIESITDPLLNAWYDAAGFEIGDKCAWDFGQPLGSTGGSGTDTDYNQEIGSGLYYLQQEWSNQTVDGSTGVAGSCIQRDLPQLDLTGTGDGSVSGGVSCSSVVCDLSAEVGDTVTLTAQPASGSSFLGWQGDCSGTGDCTVTVTPATSVTARFHTSRPPAGWAEEPLAPPAGVDPMPSADDPEWSFFRVAESAEGGERAVTIYHQPDYCFYDGTDTGGIFLERQTSAGWVDDGKLNAPAVGTGTVPLWANCNEFGAEIDLSADGSTLLASQDMAGVFDGYRCAAFVYERSDTGWQLAATLFPPGIGSDGSPTGDGCDYFGINSVLSADGKRAAVLSSGHVDVYVRGPSGWSLEQQVALPSGDECINGVSSGRLAISADGSRLLVGDPECTVDGTGGAGRVYDYERSGSTWSLAQTIDSPEAPLESFFGQGLSLSADGNTAAIPVEWGNGLPQFAGAVWVYAHDSTGWHAQVRLTTSTPEQDTAMSCPYVSGDGSQIVCSAHDSVGFDPAQGSLYDFERPGATWAGSPTTTSLRFFDPDGHAQDNLGAAHEAFLGYWPYAVASSSSGGDFATTLASGNVGLYGNDRIGEEFTKGPVVRSFSPDHAPAGAQVTLTGANFTGAEAVTFDGVAAPSFTLDSPTRITATVPPTAGVGAIGVTTTNGRGWSSDSFGPVPAVGSFAPAVGVAGTHVMIAGTNLLGTTEVDFNGVPAPSFSVSSPTRLTAVVPAAATAGAITVVTPGGSGSSSSPFLLRPVISSLVPRWAAATTRLHVEGTNLGGVATVLVAGRSARFVVASPNELVVRIPKTARGGHVVVLSPTGRAVSPDRFRPIPAITSVEPRTVRPGARFAIVGSNLGGVFRVLVHGRRARFHVINPTLIVVTVPARATSGRISVQAWGGNVSSATAVRVR